MLWNLAAGWLMMAIAAVCVIGFIFGSALHSIMREDGFGPTGNMVIFVSGFFAAIFGLNTYGISLRDVTLATSSGLAGAFVAICTLALLKATIARL